MVVDHTEVGAAVFPLSDSLQMSPISHDVALFPSEGAQSIYFHSFELLSVFSTRSLAAS